VEHIELAGFRSAARVCSFRTGKLPEGLQSELEELRRGGALPGMHRSASMSPSRREAASAGEATGEAAGEAAPRPPVRTWPPPPVPSDPDASKYAQRMEAKRRRAAEWAGFNDTKPTDANENEADVAAITEAERTVGDFKLKSDATHVPPAEARATPAKKRAQMLCLVQAAHAAKMAFNRRFLELREAKRSAVAEIRKRNARLREIHAHLGRPATLFEPALSAVEEPEARERVTEADVAALAEQKRAAAEKKAGGGGGLGGFAGGGGGGAKPDASKAAAAAAGVSPTKAAGKPEAGGGVAAPASALEIKQADYTRRRLEVEAAAAQREIDAIAAAFDARLGALHREQLAVQADAKMADVKLIVMDQELTMLRARWLGAHAAGAALGGAGRWGGCWASRARSLAFSSASL